MPCEALPCEAREALPCEISGRLTLIVRVTFAYIRPRKRQGGNEKYLPGTYGARTVTCMKTEQTRVVAGFVIDVNAPTAFEPTAAAPSSRSPKAFDRSARIASIKALCEARLNAFLAQ